MKDIHMCENLGHGEVDISLSQYIYMLRLEKAYKVTRPVPDSNQRTHDATIPAKHALFAARALLQRAAGASKCASKATQARREDNKCETIPKDRYNGGGGHP